MSSERHICHINEYQQYQGIMGLLKTRIAQKHIDTPLPNGNKKKIGTSAYLIDIHKDGQNEPTPNWASDAAPKGTPTADKNEMKAE